MTIQDIKSRAGRKLFLAVDLDGTFLGGTDQERRELYSVIETRRDEISLVFVTGRDIAFASTVPTRFGTPEPDFIVGDVGTSTAQAPAWGPHEAIEAWIESRWPGPVAAEAIMASRPSIELQAVFGGKRLSYLYSDRAEADAAAREIERAGYGALISAGVFFDVLPRGVDKGQTLLQLLAHEGVPHDTVLCAGDTLNDLSLFETGLKGVAVANAEPELRTAIDGLTNVFSATREGAGGIHEAIQHFGFLPSRQG